MPRSVTAGLFLAAGPAVALDAGVAEPSFDVSAACVVGP